MIAAFCVCVKRWKVANSSCSVRFGGSFACRCIAARIVLVELASAVIFDLSARFQWEKSVLIGGAVSDYSTPAAC